jgi:peptidyl-prolyl cis-trans isomerase B (cyclophilin B)
MFGMNKELKTYKYSDKELKKFQYAKFIMENGDKIIIKLTPETTPNTVANFATLAKDKFYDGLNFHRVIEGFMAQGGCPQGTGLGGPDWEIACETSSTQEHKKGSLSMAHAGKDTGGSQFFICFVPCPHLDGVHTVFGRIEVQDRDSLKALDNISQDDVIKQVKILATKPRKSKKS